MEEGRTSKLRLTCTFKALTTRTQVPSITSQESSASRISESNRFALATIWPLVLLFRQTRSSPAPDVVYRSTVNTKLCQLLSGKPSERPLTWVAVSSEREATPEMGMPLPTPLANTKRSGTTFQWSTAHHSPVRPAPERTCAQTGWASRKPALSLSAIPTRFVALEAGQAQEVFARTR